MKLFVFAGFVAAVAAFVLSCAGSGGIPPYGGASPFGGVYGGVGEGYGGRIRVAVTLSARGIEEVAVLEHGETAPYADEAFAELSAAMAETNSVRVDAVAGATETSKGFIAAVEAALAGARKVRAAQ